MRLTLITFLLCSSSFSPPLPQQGLQGGLPRYSPLQVRPQLYYEAHLRLPEALADPLRRVHSRLRGEHLLGGCQSPPSSPQPLAPPSHITCPP
jgi:hypothetical protein